MKNELYDRIKVIDKALDEYLPERDNPQSVIYRAMRYSVFCGWKASAPHTHDRGMQNVRGQGKGRYAVCVRNGNDSHVLSYT